VKRTLLVEKDPDSCYGATVLGLSGCYTYGNSIEELCINAKQAIRSHVEIMSQCDSEIDNLFLESGIEHWKNCFDQTSLIEVDVNIDDLKN